MSRWNRILTRIGMMLTICLMVFAGAAVAEEASGTIQITQQDTVSKKPVEGVRLTLYKIAAYTGESLSGFTIDEKYASLNISVDELGETKTAEETVRMLETLIKSAGITGLTSQTTDKNGQAVFTGLSDGIYLVRQTNSESDFEALGYTYTTDPYLVSLPRYADNGAAVRSVSCVPKGTLTTKETETTTTDVTVYKVWKDNNNRAGERPETIQVGLYNGSALAQRVTLNAAGNWSHSWKGLDAKGNWTVKELSVPTGYTAKVTKEGTAFTITNTYSQDETEGKKTTTSSGSSSGKSSGTSSGKGGSSGASSASGSPKTGDDTNLIIYMLGMLAGLSGIILLLARRQKY